MKNPSFVYFDLGNVILHFDHKLSCRQMGEVAGVEPECVREVVFESDLLEQIETGRMTMREFCEAFCQATQTQPDFERLLTAFNDIFQANVSIIPVVCQLRSAGVRLGLLSNTCESHWQWVCNQRYGLIPGYFDLHALSFEMGVMKPNAEVYQRAAELAETPPDEIFYVDDIAGHVAAACQAGFDAVQYTSTPQLVEELWQRDLRFNY